MEALKFVIVGHVDHGKSTLIGRLLFDTDSLPLGKIEEIKKASEAAGRETEFAYLLDHLEEERRRGITIETTQVFFKSGGREYVIIDAPGHVEFIKSMVTGASHAEAAVLIVDVNEGIKEQTKRHAHIVSLLGINQLIVVVNKMDLEKFSKKAFDLVRKDTEKLLGNIGITARFYVPISALKGENITKGSKKMAWYNGPAFLEALRTLKNKELPENKPLIFPVQDVYTIKDKRIVAGKLEAGIIKKGQSIRILPHNRIRKVKSIEKYPCQADKATSGESIGITCCAGDSMFFKRGDIICEEGREPFFVDSFQANIFWLSKHDLHKDQKLVLRCATQETACKIEKIKKRIDSSTLEIIEEDSGRLRYLEVGEVLVKVKKPIAIKRFSDVQELGRFVLVKDENTCAGGIVT
ncbi:MAG: 50S ribosome-binding GTPase [Elusimicrobia bacterium]|nr:50S ribosome-binding GTPase [Elusimicrobiota bacterium]